MNQATSFSWPWAAVCSLPLISMPLALVNQNTINTTLCERVNDQWRIRPNQEENYYKLKSKQWIYLTNSFILSFFTTIPAWVKMVKDNDNDNNPVLFALLGVGLPFCFCIVSTSLSFMKAIKYSDMQFYYERLPQVPQREDIEMDQPVIQLELVASRDRSQMANVPSSVNVPTSV